MKQAINLLLLFTFTLLLNAQSFTPGRGKVAGAEPVNSRTLPPYLVYRHFLAWVDRLDKAATAAGTADPYKFAEPFSRANLKPEHLDVLRNAAHRLDGDLRQHDVRAQLIVSRYRKQAKEAVEQGKPLPPPPLEIRNLERERTALLVQHYVNLRTSLGPEVNAQVDRYLNYEFTPHISLRRMSPPAVPTATEAAQ